MLKKTTPAILLLFITTASALAPLALVLIGAAGGTIAGIVGSYFLGIKPLQEDNEQLQQLNDMLNETLTKEYNIAKSTIEYAAETDTSTYNGTFMIIEDMQRQTEPYAWTLAKYTAIKRLKEELNNGTDFTAALGAAKQEALDAVRQYYINVTNNSVVMHNMYVERFTALARAGAIASWNMLISDCEDEDGCGIWTTYTVTLTDYCGNSYKIGAQVDNSNNKKYILEQIGGTNTAATTVDDLARVVTVSKTATNLSITYTIKEGSPSPLTMPCLTRIYAIIDGYDAEYGQILANIDAYFDSLSEQIVSDINLTELLDPVTLATQINNDAETTGYYGYAAAELAMLGLNLTGLNKTITIDVNGTQLSGILFTDWNGTLYTGETYNADSGHLWYFIDENGQLYDIAGQNFKVMDLRDKDGNQLNSTNFVKYVDHSGDIQKLYDELLKLTELYNEYLEMQTVAGGGSSVSDWWNSLSDTEKLALAGAAVLFIVLIARR